MLPDEGDRPASHMNLSKNADPWAPKGTSLIRLSRGGARTPVFGSGLPGELAIRLFEITRTEDQPTTHGKAASCSEPCPCAGLTDGVFAVCWVLRPDRSSWELGYPPFRLRGRYRTGTRPWADLPRAGLPCVGS